MPKKKRKLTPKQLAALARGREILFQKLLRQKRISLNAKPQIIKIIKQPIVHKITTHQHSLKVQLSLFKSFLETKFFPIEISKNKKEILNLRQLISYLFLQLNQQRNAIILNQKKISQIIGYLNSQNKRYQKEIQQLKKKILDLEKEKS